MAIGYKEKITKGYERPWFHFVWKIDPTVADPPSFHSETGKTEGKEFPARTPDPSDNRSSFARPYQGGLSLFSPVGVEET